MPGIHPEAAALNILSEAWKQIRPKRWFWTCTMSSEEATVTNAILYLFDRKEWEELHSSKAEYGRYE